MLGQLVSPCWPRAGDRGQLSLRHHWRQPSLLQPMGQSLWVYLPASTASPLDKKRCSEVPTKLEPCAGSMADPAVDSICLPALR